MMTALNLHPVLMHGNKCRNAQYKENSHLLALYRKRYAFRVTTCLENLEMSGNLTAVREMSGILLKIEELSGKSCLKLFIVNCIFVSIQVFS